MNPRPKSSLRFLPGLVAILVIAVLYLLAQPPTIPDRDADELAARFGFEKHTLRPPPGHPEKSVRSVHPSLHHVRSMISFVGAAVSLGDLDGDGQPNDLVFVDPRVDLAVVAPAGDSESRGHDYEPFALDPAPLQYDSSKMAPMGSLLGDFNEDGRADVLVYYWGRSPVLFLQKEGGTLSAASFVPIDLVNPFQVWNTSAATQADLDGDGRLDLVVGNYWPDDAPVLDAGGTGVVEMQHSLSRAYNGGRNRLFLGQSAGPLFREAEDVLDDEVARGWTFGIAAADLDGDLLPEIYFVQDFGPDRLLHNRSQPGRPSFALLHGEPTLTTPRSKVLGRDSFNGMGVDVGDVNGDGWLDLFVSNITSRYGLHESHFLFLSTGHVGRMAQGVAPYWDESEAWGVSRTGWSWEARLADFDNDGVLELMQCAGFTKGTVNRWPELQELALENDELISTPGFWPRLEPGDDVAGDDLNSFFVRGKDGRYHNVAGRVGLGEAMRSRGIATADVDGDGKIDVAVANNWEPSVFYRNTSPSRDAFLGLNLRLPTGPAAATTVVRAGRPKLDQPSRPAVGAAAKVHLPEGRVLVGQVDGGTGHSGKRSPELHFGLGKLDPNATVRVELAWRGGDGKARSQNLTLPPGWHTVLLGDAPAGETGGRP